MSKRSKFSLVDMLLGGMILALAVATGLPALLKAIERHQIAQSMNNLRQIGIAIQNHHDANNQRFPTLCDYGEGASTGHGVISLFFAITPQMESSCVSWFPNPPSAYYNSADGYAKSQVKAFFDPADPSASDDVTTTSKVNAPAAVTPFENQFTGTYTTTSYAANGMMFVPGAGIKTIIDGTSNTIMLTTRYRVCKTSDQPGDAVYNLWGMGAYGASTPSFATPLPEGDKYPTTTPPLEQFVPPTSVLEKGEITGRVGTKSMNYSDLAKSASAPCGFQVVPRGDVRCDPRIPQTMYRRGLIVCMGDVSTRIINGNTTPYLFWREVTPAGNEFTGDCW